MPIGMYHEGVDPAGMPTQDRRTRTTGKIPEADRLIIATARQHGPLRNERNVSDPMFVSLEG